MQGQSQPDAGVVVCQLPDASRDSNGRHRDSPRRQVKTRRVRDDPNAFDHVGVVEHRLSHAHEDNVGEPATVPVKGESVDESRLIEDLTGRQVLLEPHRSRRTKGAAHRAAHLAGDTCGQTSDLAPVDVRNQDGLHVSARFEANERLRCPVLGYRDVLLDRLTDAVHASQLLAEAKRQVGHLIEGAGPLP